MRQKRFLALSLVLGSALLVTTAFASAASVWTTDSMLVKKIATVGTNSNKGQLLVKGFIRNPVKGKKVYIKDHLKVQGNVQVGGILQGNNIVSADNLGTGVVTDSKLATGAVSSTKLADDAVTSDKIDMSMNGMTKAAAYISTSTPSTPVVTRSFNNLSSTTISVQNLGTGQFRIYFGTGTNERFFNVLPENADAGIFGVVQAVGDNYVDVYFYSAASTPRAPTAFFITVN